MFEDSDSNTAFMTFVDLNGDGLPDLVVGHAGGLLTTRLNDGLGGFEDPSIYTAPGSPSAVGSARLNGDGGPTVLVALFSELQLFQVLPDGGLADGTSQSLQFVGNATPAIQLAIADIDGNGTDDVVLNQQGVLQVLLGDGAGTLAAAGPITGLIDAWSFAVGDFDNDGTLDVAGFTRNESSYPTAVSIFFARGRGDGTFDSPTEVPLTPGTDFLGGVAAADFDHDGQMDLNAGGVWLEGWGDGGFSLPTQNFPWATPIIADLDDDGRVDLALTGTSSELTLVLNLADGGTASQSYGESGNSSHGIAGSALADGSHLIATAYHYGPYDEVIDVFHALADGTLQGRAGWTNAPSADAIAFAPAHLDTPNRLACARTNGALQILAIADDGGVADLSAVNLAVPIGTAQWGNQGLAWTDLNGDGLPDLLATDTNDNQLGIAFAITDGGFLLPALLLPTGVRPMQTFTGDLNRDGRVDLVTVNGGSGHGGDVSVLLGLGDGGFAPELDELAFVDEPVAEAWGDIDGDGLPDLAVADFAERIYVELSSGNGTFIERWRLGGMQANALAIGDFNGDCIPDLLISANGLQLYPGHGDGTFGAPTSVSNVSANTLQVADVNGDGIADIMAIGSSFRVRVLLGRGDGTFSERAYGVSGYIKGPAPIVDLNGDGTLDLVLLMVGGGPAPLFGR